MGNVITSTYGLQTAFPLLLIKLYVADENKEIQQISFQKVYQIHGLRKEKKIMFFALDKKWLLLLSLPASKALMATCQTFLLVFSLILMNCTKNSKQIFPEMKLRGLAPNFYIHTSGSDLQYIFPPWVLFGNSFTLKAKQN